MGDYKVYIHEGVQCGILLNTLTSLSPVINKKLVDFEEKLYKNIKTVERYKELMKAKEFFNKQIGQIEIVNKKGYLQRIFFPIITKTKYLSRVTKNKFLDEVNRETENDKLFGFLKNMKLFEDEMNHFMRLKKNGLKFSLTYFSRLRDLNLIIALVTNIFILFESEIAAGLFGSYRDSLIDGGADPTTLNIPEDYGTARTETVIRILGVVHLGLSGLVLLFWIVFQAPIEVPGSFREFDYTYKDRDDKETIRKHNILKRWYNVAEYKVIRFSYMLFDTYLFYLSIFLLFAILGVALSKIFFTFLLLDIIDRSIILNNVIKSVTLNYRQLLMTLVLGIMIMYVYGVLGYFTVLQGDDAINCDSVFHCFLYVSNNGLRAGGGVGEALGIVGTSDVEYFSKRYFFDLSYFLIIIIVLLNIIFGIIIDTFAELRDVKQLKGKIYWSYLYIN
jgi:hypothetical protein